MPTQEELIAEQKAACPFCKIVTGEIPAQKVYEDDQIIAILDINPASKGHLLVMPKEHYPIMPLIPDKTFNHLFRHLKFLSVAQKDGMVIPANTWYVANGGVAGQRSSHFMVHLIPREENDKLHTAFGYVPATLAEDQVNGLGNMIIPALKKLLKEFNPAELVTEAGVVPPKTIDADRKKRLAQRLEEDAELRQLLINDPSKLLERLAKDKELSDLFEGVDLHMLSDKLKQVYQ